MMKENGGLMAKGNGDWRVKASGEWTVRVGVSGVMFDLGSVGKLYSLSEMLARIQVGERSLPSPETGYGERSQRRWRLGGRRHSGPGTSVAC